MHKNELATLETLRASLEKRRARLGADTVKTLSDGIGAERKRIKRMRNASSALANASLALVLAVMPLSRFAMADRPTLPLLLAGGAGVSALGGLIYAEVAKGKFKRNLLALCRNIRRRPEKDAGEKGYKAIGSSHPITLTHQGHR